MILDRFLDLPEIAVCQPEISKNIAMSLQTAQQRFISKVVFWQHSCVQLDKCPVVTPLVKVLV